jgi:hypothetical protein
MAGKVPVIRENRFKGARDAIGQGPLGIRGNPQIAWTAKYGRVVHGAVRNLGARTRGKAVSGSARYPDQPRDIQQSRMKSATDTRRTLARATSSSPALAISRSSHPLDQLLV